MQKIRMRQYFKYVTTDEEEFDDRIAAEEHQRALNILPLITYETDPIDYATFIVKFLSEIITIVNDQDP